MSSIKLQKSIFVTGIFVFLFCVMENASSAQTKELKININKKPVYSYDVYKDKVKANDLNKKWVIKPTDESNAACKCKGYHYKVSDEKGMVIFDDKVPIDTSNDGSYTHAYNNPDGELKTTKKKYTVKSNVIKIRIQ